jgi:hypothetical protein
MWRQRGMTQSKVETKGEIGDKTRHRSERRALEKIHIFREREKRQKERNRGWRHATEKTERKRQRGREKVGDREGKTK